MGFSRTGFLICKYLIAKENWVAEEAVKAFEEARGHEIERLEYKATLLGQEIPDEPEASEFSSSRKRDAHKVSGTCETFDQVEDDYRIGFHNSSKRAGKNQKFYPDEHWAKNKNSSKRNWNESGYRKEHWNRDFRQSNRYQYEHPGPSNYTQRQRGNRYHGFQQYSHHQQGLNGFNQYHQRFNGYRQRGWNNDRNFETAPQNYPRRFDHFKQTSSYQQNVYSTKFRSDNEKQFPTPNDVATAGLKSYLNIPPR